MYDAYGEEQGYGEQQGEADAAGSYQGDYHDSQSYSRNNSWRRRSRSRSRSPRGRRRRSRSRDRYRERGSGRDRDWDRDRDSTLAVNKLALINLPLDVDRNMILSVMTASGFLATDIRVIHRHDRGAPRSFGFIDFADVRTASRWMDINKGQLLLADGRSVRVEFAKNDQGRNGGSIIRSAGDWTCANCTASNHSKRELCYKCDTEYTVSQELEKQGIHMVGVAACDTLLLRGLPVSCTTKSIFEALIKNTSLSSIVQLQISDSKQYAYVHMISVYDATLLLNASYKTPITVEGVNVAVSYSLHSLTKLAQMQLSMLQGRDVDASGSGVPVHGAEVAQAAIVKAAALKQAQAAVTQGVSGSSSQYAQTQPSAQGSSGLNTPSNPGVVGITPTPRGIFPKYVVPNPAEFTAESSSGYFMDPATTFYYDPKTQYYFNQHTKKWSFWDPTYQTYFAVDDPNMGAIGSAARQQAATIEKEPATPMPKVQQFTPTPKQDVKPEDNKSKKSATDVAKEMMKWAKKQEKDKTKIQMQLKPLKTTLETKSAFETKAGAGPSSSASAGADLTYRMLEKSKNPLAHLDDDEEDAAPSPPPGARTVENSRALPAPVQMEMIVRERRVTEPPAPETPSVRKPSAQEEREAMERSLVDEAKKMCLLCKRAFPSVDVLRKHVDKSDLHRKNLEEKRVEWGKQYVASMLHSHGTPDETAFGGSATEETGDRPLVYRDRAKERRQQYGIDDSYAERNSDRAGGNNEESLRRDAEMKSNTMLGDDNIGNRLLKGMGWREGQGVGKNSQGIVNPIQAELRVQGAGLGVSGSRLGGGEMSHKERVRATFYSRYNDV